MNQKPARLPRRGRRRPHRALERSVRAPSGTPEGERRGGGTGRGLLVPRPRVFHHRSELHQPQQRKRQPRSPVRADGDAPVLGHHQHEPVVLRRRDARSEGRGRETAAGRCVRLRSRRDGHHPEHVRVDADRAARTRPEAGRRSPHHDPGLSAHAHCLAPAGGARWHRPQDRFFSHSADRSGRSALENRARHHPAHAGPSHLPRDLHHRAHLPGERDLRYRAGAGQSRLSSTALTASRISPSPATISTATTTPRAFTSGSTRPVGTGFLYVRRSKIRDLWPLMAAPLSMRDDVRKFEEIGTHPIALKGAITEALTFHEGIGAERKAARLRFLRQRLVGPGARSSFASASSTPMTRGTAAGSEP